MNTDEINEKHEELQYTINEVQEEFENLVHLVRTEINSLERLRRDASEEAFDLLLQNGLNVGAQFEFQGKVWKITGINCSGFRIEHTSNGETKKLTLPAVDKDEVKRFLDSVLILEPESEVNHD